LTRASEQTVPRLATGVRLKLDEARNCWSILAPERVLMPDETALEILRRCNGRSSLSEIIDELAAGYDVDREVIARDVCTMVGGLVDKGILCQ
jgi:pyrroloquinoline quinone biosynthesis protein D